VEIGGLFLLLPNFLLQSGICFSLKEYKKAWDKNIDVNY
jgi:hypothetical protein